MAKAGITIFFSLASKAVLLFVLASSCTPESCYQDTESGVRALFYETGTGLNIATDSVSVTGIGMDTLTLYDKAREKKDIVLPLNPAAAECSFVITINGITDTIIMRYTTYPHLISKECGYSLFHKLQSYSSTNNLIDTIIVQNPQITIPNEENIRIFF
jgi:predicted nucleic-acid-binding Zn-ribbon protein